MTTYTSDTASEDQRSEIDDKKEEYYDDDDRESLLYFHSFLQALANLYIFYLGFLSAYKWEVKRSTYVFLLNILGVIGNIILNLVCLSHIGKSCVNVMISCHVKSCIITAIGSKHVMEVNIIKS